MESENQRSQRAARIVFFALRLADDGGTRVLVDLANGLVSRGWSVHITIPRGAYRTRYPVRATINEVGLDLRFRLLSLAVNLPLMLMRAPRAQVYIGSMPPIPIVVFLASRLNHAIGFNFVQGDDLNFFDDRSLIKSRTLLWVYRAVAWLSWRLPLLAFANSRWTANLFREATGRFCPVVTPGINLEAFRPRTSLPAPAPPWRISCVGAKARAKGLSNLLDALRILHARGYALHLSVASKDDLVIEPVPFQVSLLHPKSDEELCRIFWSSHVFVHASWREGFGLPPLEAMACGVSVVVADSGGVNEFAIDGWNCKVVAPRDPRGLADAIERILLDPELGGHLARNGVAMAARFSFQKGCDTVNEAFKSAVFGHSKRAVLT